MQNATENYTRTNADILVSIINRLLCIFGGGVETVRVNPNFSLDDDDDMRRPILSAGAAAANWNSPQSRSSPSPRLVGQLLFLSA